MRYHEKVMNVKDAKSNNLPKIHGIEIRHGLQEFRAVLGMRNNPVQSVPRILLPSTVHALKGLLAEAAKSDTPFLAKLGEMGSHDMSFCSRR